MAILEGDIKLVASAVMDDVPEGGGAPTSHVIVDGASNGIFNDISELDRAGGRDNFRKLFASVQTTDTAGYFGANVIVAEPPSDPRVSVTLFATGDTFDTRESAKSRVESYLSIGSRFPGRLFGTHIAGQAVITVLQRENDPLPVVGDSMVLRKNEGIATQFEQYVKVIKVASRLRTFTDSTGDYNRLEVTLNISDTLSADFPGFEATRQEPTEAELLAKTKVYGTIIADAARYYGVVPLVQAASVGDYSVNASSIFTQLVPSTRVEVPIADARINQRKATLLKAGEPYNDVIAMTFTTAQAMFIGAKVLPGSLSLSRGGITLTDKGGLLVNGDNSVGTIDYENGILRLTSNIFGTGSGSHTVSYTPAATPTAVTSSIGIPVTVQGQRLSWSFSLDSLPARASLQISYRTLSRWYVLTDDGSGAIRGADSSFGAGTLNFATGSVSLTLGALPDVGSEIILQWVDTVNTRPINLIPSEGPSLPKAFGTIVQIDRAVNPGSIVLTWNDGTARTATDVAGVLTGDASGSIQYANGQIAFKPDSLPAKNTSVNLAIVNALPVLKGIPAFADGGSYWTCSLGDSVKPRSVEARIFASYIWSNYIETGAAYSVAMAVFDDGAGNLQVTNLNSNLSIGTINYATGEISIAKQIPGWEVSEYVLANSAVANESGQSVSYASYTPVLHSKTLTVLNGGNEGWWTSANWWPQDMVTFALRARYAGSAGAGENFSFTLDTLFSPMTVIPTAFTLGGHRHISLSDSTFARDPDPLTGNGTPCGAMGTVGGAYGVVLSDWIAGTSSAITNLQGCDAPGTDAMIGVATFRSAVSPLYNGAFSVQGIRQDGTTFNASPDINGVINSNGVFGKVDFDSGVATVRFGILVTDDHAADPGVIDIRYMGIAGVNYIKADAVKADSLRYNAVGYSYLPLDATILGLNPVRLPNDGRVPIFRPGGFVVIGHTAYIGPVTVSNGQTIDCARVRLSRIRVLDANNTLINIGYTTDLEAGHITFNDVSAYAQPVKIEHRIEDMMRISDAQINGQLTLTAQLTHDYPVGAYVSSALVIGDMHARVSVLFDQQTWTNAWQDSVIGAEATGTYNQVLTPVVVTNKGALTERWSIQFTNTTSFIVMGEHVGVIANGTTSADCAPINPATGTPYFSLAAIGWGSGWAAGNVLRFNTVGACYPIWVVRTIQQGPATATDDQFTLLIRGDVDQA